MLRMSPFPRLAALALAGAVLSSSPPASAAEGDAPDAMRAIVMTANGGPEVLQLRRLPVPEPGAGQVRIRVHAAGVNPIDWKLREGRRPPPGGQAAAFEERVPGFDVAGIVDKPGPGVDAFAAGEAVVASAVRGVPGGYAEYVVVPVGDVARKPARLSFHEAAGLPTAAVTALRSLDDRAKLQAGERILIQGGAGGVGSAAVQIAKARGAHVIATASAGNQDYLRAIGVDEPIDYRAVRFEDAVRDVDVVFDTVGGETLERSLGVLRKGGRLVTIAGRVSPEACAAAGVTCPAGGPPAPGAPVDWFGAQLAELGALADRGELAVNLFRVFPLEQAAEAQELNREGRTRGKIVLELVGAQGPDPASNP